MADRTTCQHFLAADLILLFKGDAVCRLKIPILPLHVVDLGLRPDELLGLAMASKAPFHLERVFLINSGHIVYLPVACRTTNAFSYMNAVVEVGVLRQVVHTFPFDRSVISEACTDRLQIGAICPDLAMAVHTGLRRRHAGRRGGLNARVTVPAIDTVVARVMLVAELNRLLLFHVTARQIRRTGDLRVHVERRTGKYNAQDHTDPGDIVCTLMEKLSHLKIPSKHEPRSN